MKSYPGLIDIDNEITRLIGAFVARWSLAEFSLMLAFMVGAHSSRQEVATTILASTPSAEAKIRVVRKLLDVAPIGPDQHEEIRVALKKLEKLCPARNALMHHLWARREDGKIITIDYRSNDSIERQSIRNADDIKKLCNDVVDATLSISKAAKSKWINDKGAKALKL